MGKKVFSLCMVLVLCLGLLPATALAAAPPENQVIYVGGVVISSTGYWTTDDEGNVTEYTGEGTPTDNYIHYDVAKNTLTLHNATIKESVSTGTSTLIAGTAIGVLNQNGAAELTITLAGTNTIAEVSMGICVLAFSDSTGDASLTITGTGSLTAEGRGYGNHSGIMVQSNGGKAELTINNVDVTATNTSNNQQGILLQSANSSPATLTVNGGELTASGQSAGIKYFIGSGESGSGTPSLTVSNNAIVRANGGISDNSSTDIQIEDGNNSSGGIVFDDDKGTVYGDVTLQGNLEISEGESLTLDVGASLNANGHNVIVDGGTLDSTLATNLGDSVIYKVTQVELGKTSLTLNVGDEENLIPTITPDNATDKSVTWESSASGVATVDTSGKVTAVSVGTATITATAADGSGEKATCSVTVNAAAIVPVESVSLDKTSLELTEGGTARLTATILPDNATNKNVTWSTSDASIATVTDGVVTAVAPGTATITVTTEDGSKTATCAVTVAAATVPVTGVTLNKTSTSLYVGDTETLTATVAPDNATDRAVNWTSSNPSVATVENGVVTAVGAGTATITVTTQDNDYTASCTVTVSRYSSGGGSSSSSTSLSDRAIDDIQDARPGDTVEITLRPGRTTLEREVFEELAGQDITLEIDAGDGVLWTVNGLDIPEDTRLHDLDLDVDLGDSDIPATVLNAVTGEIGAVQLSLAHDGEFGFTMTLSAPLGRDNADYWANLYWFNEGTEELEFQQAARIAEDGTAEFDLDHASDYAIVIDDRSHEPVDLPFNDVPEGAWYEDAAAYVYKHGLMAGTSATTFAPDVTTSRAMIATILWRMAGSPVVNYAMNYTDVAQGQWCSEAIRWATSEGIAGGYGGGVFGPSDTITREQLAVMLYRFAQAQGYDVTASADLSGYTDVGEVSSYAAQALSWTAAEGIINGTGATTLSPDGSATRAQVAVILMRFCQEFVEEAN